jgi:hypothetical protein
MNILLLSASSWTKALLAKEMYRTDFIKIYSAFGD